jgi:4-amino-4-deoxy-L-arabinose transferase-like glycosyltransferase
MRRDQVPILLLIVASAIGLTLLAPLTWLILLTDGLFAVAVLATAAGWGAWPVVWFGFRSRTLGQQVCIATALGLGLLATATLIFGIAGLLSQSLAWALLAAGGVLGLARIYHAQAPRRTPASEASASQRGLGILTVRSLTLLLLAPPLVVALFGASLPPGVLWQEEANGYDVLEYHLQGPREYYDAGRITFLPHNVYTSFPQQMEMLYLLLMYLAGGVYAAAIPAQLLHAGCGVLAVVALSCWARAGWTRWLVVVLAGSTPWLAYLGCLAYVENGMLFFAAVAAGLLTECYREQDRVEWRTAVTAGLCAGLAGGCKYPALVFVAGALGLSWFVTMRAGLKLRVQHLAMFGLGAAVAVSPWLIRNAAFTGNPVYPFAYEWLGGRAWSAEQARQWSAAHRVPPEYDSVAGRLSLAAREFFGSVSQRRQTSSSSMLPDKHELHSSLFGQALFVLALAGFAFGRSRQALMLALWSALILLGWISLTFITGRFAVPLIVPLALLAGQTGESRSRSESSRTTEPLRPGMGWRWPVLLVALAGALVNDAVLAGRLQDHDQRWRRRAGSPIRALVGRTDVFVGGHLLNQALPADAYAWLVGDAAVFYVERRIHYTVAFSRDPWLERAATGSTPQECLDWLRAQNVSHVVFNWSEIERLRSTYGFAESVTPRWVTHLAQAGLQRVELETPPTPPAPVEIYQVVSEGLSRPGRRLSPGHAGQAD